MAKRKQELPYMPLMTEKLLADEFCQDITNEQFGAYMRLLIWQWHEGSIPCEIERLARRLNVTCEHFVEHIWCVLSSKFPCKKRNRLLNSKLDEVRVFTLRKIKTNYDNGCKGGRPKGKGNSEAKTERLSESVSQKKANGSIRAFSSSSSSSSKTKRGCGGDWPERIYQAYPVKEGKAKALKAIEKAIKAIAKTGRIGPAQWLLERVQKWAVSPRAQADTKPTTPAPAPWFNGGRYDDSDSRWQETWDNESSPARVRAPAGKYAGI